MRHPAKKRTYAPSTFSKLWAYKLYFSRTKKCPFQDTHFTVKNLQSKYFLLTLMNTKYSELSKIFTFERRYIIFYSYQNISRSEVPLIEHL